MALLLFVLSSVLLFSHTLAGSCSSCLVDVLQRSPQLSCSQLPQTLESCLLSCNPDDSLRMGALVNSILHSKNCGDWDTSCGLAECLHRWFYYDGKNLKCSATERMSLGNCMKYGLHTSCSMPSSVADTITDAQHKFCFGPYCQEGNIIFTTNLNNKCNRFRQTDIISGTTWGWQPVGVGVFFDTTTCGLTGVDEIYKCNNLDDI